MAIQSSGCATGSRKLLIKDSNSQHEVVDGARSEIPDPVWNPENVVYFFRGILGIETPPIWHAPDDLDPYGMLCVTWDCWEDYDAGESVFTAKMGSAGVSVRQAFVALNLSHAHRVRRGVLDIRAVTASKEYVPPDPVEHEKEADRHRDRAMNIIRNLYSKAVSLPYTSRLIGLAEADLRESGEASDAWMEERWAENAVRTAISAQALCELEMRQGKESGLAK